MTGEQRPHCLHIVGSKGKKRPCKNSASHGDYCATHAYHPERRIEQSQVSLHEYVDDAIRALGRIVVDGQKEADIIKAALGILDRTGHGPAQTVTMQGSDERLDELIRARRDQ